MNADTTGGGRALHGGVLGGTAGDGWGRAAAYDAYADGLHTYALWYLCDHDAAADAVYCAFAAADRNHTTLQQPEQIQPWLYALLRRECRLRAGETDAPVPVSGRLRPKEDGLGESGVGASLLQLEGNLRRAEFHSLAWAEAEGLAPAHREVLELTIRHGLDSRGLALVLGLREGAAGLASTRGFGLLADAWRELERSLAAAAVAGSGRDNCAQLAELTFGWSGKLNATLRAPLTEHVDRCSRCQHYLHTVIGTPSAPTILPFVAAPRALRDLLLGELADADAALAAGVDLVALGRRCGGFGPEGFPARVDLSQNSATAAAGTGAGPVRPPRRRQTSARLHRTPRVGAGVPTGVARPSAAAPEAARSEQAKPEAALSTATSAISAASAVSPSTTSPRTAPSPESQAPGMRARAPEAEDLFRARGSWAERVLPPQGAVAAAASAEESLWRPEPAAEFVQTASGRFATRTPMPPRPPRPSTAMYGAVSSSVTSSSSPSPKTSTQPSPETSSAPEAGDAESAAAASRLPRYARNNSRSAGARARHKARPMRQAVVSAMALGAVGAVAAAAAALIGSGGEPHANTVALDNTQPNEVVGGAPTSAGQHPSQDRLSVSVTTAGAAAQATGLGSPSGTGSSAAASSPTTAASGGFFVSVNQRDGDPYSVQILLRNAGTAPLKWSASPDVSWLTLSQRSGTLAPGQSLTVTATATSAAPSGQWVAQITFQPGGILVTMHGGIAAPPSSAPASSTPTGAPTSSSPSSAPTTPSSAPSTSSSAPVAPPISPTASTSAGDSATPSQAGSGAAPSASVSATRTRKPPPASGPVRRHAVTR